MLKQVYIVSGGTMKLRVWQMLVIGFVWDPRRNGVLISRLIL